MTSIASFAGSPPAFFLIRSARTTAAEALCDAIASTPLPSRVSLLLDTQALERLDLASFRRRQVGCTLDLTDAKIGFAIFASEELEAVRFAPRFVQESLASIRGACVLDSMLRLSKELGLLTLGPSGSRPPWSSLGFDYLLDEGTPADRKLQ